MLSILSPAKKLNFEPLNRNCESSEPIFNARAARLAKVAATLGSTGIAKLMNISPKLAELNDKRFKKFSNATSHVQTKQAVFAFAGDTYVGLDATTINPSCDIFFQENIRILSGLYGVLKPFDMIQPYRLEMGSKLETSSGNNLYQFWGDTILRSLETELEKHSGNEIINLASDEYFKVLGKKNFSEQVITPKFYEKKAGNYKLISFFAKKARGLMARYIVTNKLTNPEDLKSFNLANYRYEQDKSSKEVLVFSRETKG